MVWKLDRLGRSLPHLLTTIADLKERGVAFRSLTEQIDTTTSQGELLFHIFGALAQFERVLIQERVQAGLAAARRRGRQGGRPVAIDAEKLTAVIAALDTGTTKAAVCRTFGIRRSTLVDSLARVGWSAGLKGPGGMSGATAATERNPDRRFFDPPTEQRELVRHYTLSDADHAAIRRHRGEHNRLGYALMLCYLHFPGRALRAGERPPIPLLAFVADQIDALPDCIDEYLAAERNRQRHAIECQEQLGLRPFGRRATAELTDALLAQAIENDRLSFLAEAVMQACRTRAIVAPSPAALERLCVDLRHRARREAHRRLTKGLSAEQRKRLDTLTEHREGSCLSWLTWLRQMPEAAKPAAMLGLIKRLEHVRTIGVEPGRGHLIHQARLAQLAREAGRTTVQHVAGYERQRRHATLVAITLNVTASLTDQAIELFDRLVGAMFRKAEQRHARAFQADARAINEKVRLYARVGAALIAARDDKQDAYGAIAAVIPWERFRVTVAEAEALARPDEFDTIEKLGRHYAGIRRWSPAFLDAFEFEGVPACASLMRAIMVLRETNRSGVGLPKSAPTGFVRQRWAPYVLPGGTIDRRHYELCMLAELRDRLPATSGSPAAGNTDLSRSG